MLYADGERQVAEAEVVFTVFGSGIFDGPVVALQQSDASVGYEDGGATKEISGWREGEIGFIGAPCMIDEKIGCDSTHGSKDILTNNGTFQSSIGARKVMYPTTYQMPHIGRRRLWT